MITTWVLLVTLGCSTIAWADRYYVIVTGDSSVVLGGTLRLSAQLYDFSGLPAFGDYIFSWKDDAIPHHSQNFTVANSISHFNISYDPSIYAPGPYTVEVIVYEKEWFIYERVVSRRVEVNITSLLSGKIFITQNNTVRDNYVSTGNESTYTVGLTRLDEEFVKENRPQIVTYWFKDCEYLGAEEGLVKNFNFTKPEKTHYIEALVVASVLPPPPPTTTTPAPTTTTTTTTPAPTTTTTSTTSAPTTTTSKPTPPPTTTTTPATTTSTTVPTSSVATTTPAPVTTTKSPPLNESSPWNDWLSGFKNKTDTPGFCVNMSTIPFSMNTSTYGYFKSKIVTKDPVSKVVINGSNWLKEGDFLKIGITCNGTGPFTYCVQLTDSSYNVTGDEKCDPNRAKNVTDCALVFGHLFSKPKEYKLLFIIANVVNKLVTPVGINVYQVPKQPQLSTWIVPITSAIVAVILIVFGFAYYIHSRRTYIIEVADFDFGQQSADMEYKTFSERLREAVLNSFFRTNDPVDSDSAEGWSPSRKYGSMQ